MTRHYPKYVAPSIACEVFGVTSQTLRRWAKTGKISFIKTPGGQYRYNVEGVIGVLQAPVTKATRKHPAAPVAISDTPASPARVAKQVDIEEAIAAVQARMPEKPTIPASPPMDPAALRQKIEALATASG